jgi:hypothetical protein
MKSLKVLQDCPGATTRYYNHLSHSLIDNFIAAQFLNRMPLNRTNAPGALVHQHNVCKIKCTSLIAPWLNVFTK